MESRPKVKIGGKSVFSTFTLISSINEDIEIAPFGDDFDLYTLKIKFVIDESLSAPIFNHWPEEHVRVVEIKGGTFTSFSNSVSMHVANWLGKAYFLDVASHPFGPLETLKRQTTVTLYEGA